MSRIRIKHFGPIKEGLTSNDGWIDIKKVTLFIGNQGSGKSTVAKLISTFTWMEKALNRGDGRFETEADFIKALGWQKINNYLTGKSHIEYHGSRFKIGYDEFLVGVYIDDLGTDNYVVPKVMYVPAERNFLTTIKNAFNVTGLPGPLQAFAEELRKTQIYSSDAAIELPLNNMRYKYDFLEDVSYLLDNNHKIDLIEASSGFQSLVPLYLVSNMLANAVSFDDFIGEASLSADQSVRRDREIAGIMLNNSFSSEEKQSQVAKVVGKYFNRCFINIVEEPEQNLFPSSQRETLNSLLNLNNICDGNKLIMTTHSPYLVNFLSISIQAHALLQKIRAANRPDLEEKLAKVIPLASCVAAEDVAIYELDEKTGTISLLPNYEGIPSDKNYLNQYLREGNLAFDSLLEIEEEL